jgi:hypothetical protein
MVAGVEEAIVRGCCKLKQMLNSALVLMRNNATVFGSLAMMEYNCPLHLLEDGVQVAPSLVQCRFSVYRQCIVFSGSSIFYQT